MYQLAPMTIEIDPDERLRRIVERVEQIKKRLWGPHFRIHCECKKVFEGPKDLMQAAMLDGKKHILCPNCLREDKFSFEVMQ
jgi:hypothetical protein